MTRKTIFVSSTFNSLRDYRELLIQEFQNDQHFALELAEHDTPSASTVEECITEQLKRSDVFIGLYGHYYGSQPTHETKSYCEIEYEKALTMISRSKIFFFLVEDGAQERWTSEQPKLAVKQKKFRKTIQEAHARILVDKPEDFVRKVRQSLHSIPQPYWINGSGRDVIPYMTDRRFPARLNEECEKFLKSTDSLLNLYGIRDRGTNQLLHWMRGPLLGQDGEHVSPHKLCPDSVFWFHFNSEGSNHRDFFDRLVEEYHLSSTPSKLVRTLRKKNVLLLLDNCDSYDDRGVLLTFLTHFSQSRDVSQVARIIATSNFQLAVARCRPAWLPQGDSVLVIDSATVDARRIAVPSYLSEIVHGSNLFTTTQPYIDSFSTALIELVEVYLQPCFRELTLATDVHLGKVTGDLCRGEVTQAIKALAEFIRESKHRSWERAHLAALARDLLRCDRVPFVDEETFGRALNVHLAAAGHNQSPLAARSLFSACLSLRALHSRQARSAKLAARYSLNSAYRADEHMGIVRASWLLARAHFDLAKLDWPRDDKLGLMNCEAAKSYAHKAIDVCARIENNSRFASGYHVDSFFLLARISQAEGATSIAIESAETAMALAERKGWRLQKADLHNLLAEIYAAQRKYSLVRFHLDQATQSAPSYRSARQRSAQIETMLPKVRSVGGY